MVEVTPEDTERLVLRMRTLEISQRVSRVEMLQVRNDRNFVPYLARRAGQQIGAQIAERAMLYRTIEHPTEIEHVFSVGIAAPETTHAAELLFTQLRTSGMAVATAICRQKAAESKASGGSNSSLVASVYLAAAESIEAAIKTEAEKYEQEPSTLAAVPVAAAIS